MSKKRQTTGTATKLTLWIGMLAAVATWGIANLGAQRDPGVNQPGAAGNRAAAPAGYGGSARQVRAVKDPGVNQPGAAGNTGRDPGLNQPGRAGNRR